MRAAPKDTAEVELYKEPQKLGLPRGGSKEPQLHKETQDSQNSTSPYGRAATVEGDTGQPEAHKETQENNNCTRTLQE